MKFNIKPLIIVLLLIGGVVTFNYLKVYKISNTNNLVELPSEISRQFIESTKGNLLFGTSPLNPGISDILSVAKKVKWIDRTNIYGSKQYVSAEFYVDTKDKSEQYALTFYKFDKNILSETLNIDNFYSSFDDAVQFAVVTPYEEIPKFEGSKDKGGKYERYSITKLSDVLAQQSKEATKKATIQVTCKGDGEDIMTFLLLSDKSTTDGKRYIDYITRPSIYLTLDEVYDCFQARDSQNLRDIHDMNNTRYPESLQIDKDSIETNYPIYQNLFKK